MIEMGVCEQKQVRGGDCSAQHPASRIAPAQHQLSRRGDADPFVGATIEPGAKKLKRVINQPDANMTAVQSSGAIMTAAEYEDLTKIWSWVSSGAGLSGDEAQARLESRKGTSNPIPLDILHLGEVVLSRGVWIKPDGIKRKKWSQTRRDNLRWFRKLAKRVALEDAEEALVSICNVHTIQNVLNVLIILVSGSNFVE
jgi:hypothetical protein